MRSVGILFGFALLGHSALVVAQEVPPEPVKSYQEFTLSLRPAKSAYPAMKYPLLATLREQKTGNAAIMYHRANTLMLEQRIEDPKAHYAKREEIEKEMNQPFSKIDPSKLYTYVNGFPSGTFREIRAATFASDCDWGLAGRIDADGIGLLLPEVQRLRELAFLLKVRCRANAVAGKVDEALADIRDGLSLGRRAADGDTLIQHLVGIAITTIFLSELEFTLQSANCPNMYWPLTHLPRPFCSLRKAMEGEMRMIESTVPLPKNIDKGPISPEEAAKAWEDIFDRWSKLGNAEPGTGPPIGMARLGSAAFVTMQLPEARKGLVAAGLTEDEVKAMPAAQIVLLNSLNRYRDLRDETFSFFEAPFAERQRAGVLFENRLKAAKQKSADPLAIMIALLAPAINKVVDAHDRMDRRIAGLRAVEAIRLHWAKTGKLPAKLDDIDGVAIPVDPLSHKPFEYQPGENGFTLIVAPPPGQPGNLGNNWRYAVKSPK